MSALSNRILIARLTLLRIRVAKVHPQQRPIQSLKLAACGDAKPLAGHPLSRIPSLKTSLRHGNINLVEPTHGLPSVDTYCDLDQDG
jgi:hypothetical protein